MDNSQMKPGRFLRIYKAKTLCNRITSHLSSGGIVVVATYTKATQYSAKHANMFKATKSGCYVMAGKGWNCIDHCAIRFH